MADRLAKKFGTEDDKVNCPFYYKIGACRHGDSCTRQHNKPPLSQTLLFFHIYPNPRAAIAFAEGIQAPQEELREAAHHFEEFFEEVFVEYAKQGEILDMIVADNIGEHMIGNLYVKFATEEQAEAVLRTMTGKYYNQNPIQVEYSPVTDFREAKCRQYTEGQCERGGYCNFIHPKHISADLRKQYQAQMYELNGDYREARDKRKAEGIDEDDLCGDLYGRAGGPSERRPRRRERDGDRDRRDGGRRDRGDRDRPRDRDSHYRRGNDMDRRDGRDGRDRDRDRDRDRNRDQGRDRRRDGSRDRHRGRDEPRARDGEDDRHRARRRDDGDRSKERSRSGRDRRGRDYQGDADQNKISPQDNNDKRHDEGDRHRSEDKGKDNRNPPGNRSREESLGRRVMKQSSQERRAMIAQWAADDEAEAHKVNENKEQEQNVTRVDEDRDRQQQDTKESHVRDINTQQVENPQNEHEQNKIVQQAQND